MAFDFKFPDVGEGIHEGKIVKWLIKEGDSVKTDQSIAEVETDKAVVEIPSPQAGKIIKLYHGEGEMMKVGEVMATIEGADVPVGGGAPTQEAGEKHEESTGVIGSLEPTAVGVMKAPAGFGGGAVFSGTTTGNNSASFGNNGAVFGNNGPIFVQEKTTAVPAQNPAPSQSAGSVTQPAPQTSTGGSMAGVIKSGIKAVKKYDLFGYVDRAAYEGVRKAIGDHMVKSLGTAAQVTHMDTADVTDLWMKREKEKKEAEKQGVKLTILPYIVQALCEGLKKHPFLNAMLDEANREIILRKYYNIGIAVDTEAGLMVPVLKAADRKDVVTMAREITDLAEKCRTRKINSMDFKGGTFTITNVGSAGSTKFFTPVINFPESAILGIGLMEDAPVVRNSKVEIRKVMYLSLTYDHRIVDGAEAARFMKDFKELLQKTPST